MLCWYREDKKFHGFNYPVVSFLFDEINYANFKDYQINNNIVELIDDKYPILCIRIDENDKAMAGLSIIDNDSGLKFVLPDQGISEPLLKFIKSTIPTSKIVVIAGSIRDGQILFDRDVKQQPLLILDGFIFE